MENQTTSFDTLDEIIFEHRNKQYGAYLLRTEYTKIVKRATMIGVLTFGLTLATPLLWAIEKEGGKQTVEIALTDVKLPPPPEKLPIPEPPMTPPEAVPVKTIKYNVFEIVPDNPVIDLPPTQDELAESKAFIGSENIAGAEVDTPPVDIDLATTTPIAEPVTVEKTVEQPFLSAEVMPEFRGGMNALINYLQKNLRFPEQAQQVGVSGKVYLQFVVATDGSISQLKVIRGIGFGCDEEALRVVSKMPKWLPGKQSGRAVPVRFTLPIAFQVVEE